MKCVTRHHGNHYLGFAKTQWNLFGKENPPRIKPLLYVYRVLLTGIYLMRTGRIEANLATLKEEFRLSYISDLIAFKMGRGEQVTLKVAEIEFHSGEYGRLVTQLKQAGSESQLLDEPAGRADLNDLLIRLRLHSL